MPPHLLQFAAPERPVVVWNITSRCNLRCRHCYLEAGEEKTEELDAAAARLLAEELVLLRVPVVLFSGGEPLLRRDVFDLARRFSEGGVRPVLSTNGTLITPEVARSLKEAGFAYVGISLDGDAPAHDSWRGVPGAFARALDGARHAREAGLKVGFRFTVHRDNKEDLPFLLELAVREAVPRFCVYHLVYAGRGRSFILSDLSPRERRELVHYLLEETLRLGREGVELEILTTDNHADGVYLLLWTERHAPERLPEVRQLLALHGGCSAGVKMVNIDPAGYIYPCQFWRFEALGKFPEESFAAIWRSNRDLLAKLRDKGRYLKGKCGKCRFKDVCGGCRVRAAAATGDPWEADPACYLEPEEIGCEEEGR